MDKRLQANFQNTPVVLNANNVRDALLQVSAVN